MIVESRISLEIDQPTIDSSYQKNKLTIEILDSILPSLYGPKGKAAVDLFRWLRWVDDTVDENEELTPKQKLKFLERQEAMVVEGIFINGQTEPAAMENLAFNALKAPGVPQKQLKDQLLILLVSIKDDAENFDWQPKSSREVRHDNWRANLPSLQIFSLILNGKPLTPTTDFMRFLDSRTTLGNLFQLREDLSQRLSKLPLNRQERESIMEPPINERQAEILAIYDKDEKRFKQLRADVLKEMRENRAAFFSLGLPWWQSLILLLYNHELFARRSNKIHHFNETV